MSAQDGVRNDGVRNDGVRNDGVRQRSPFVSSDESDNIEIEYCESFVELNESTTKGMSEHSVMDCIPPPPFTNSKMLEIAPPPVLSSRRSGVRGWIVWGVLFLVLCLSFLSFAVLVRQTLLELILSFSTFVVATSKQCLIVNSDIEKCSSSECGYRHAKGLYRPTWDVMVVDSSSSNEESKEGRLFTNVFDRNGILAHPWSSHSNAIVESARYALNSTVICHQLGFGSSEKDEETVYCISRNISLDSWFCLPMCLLTLLGAGIFTLVLGYGWFRMGGLMYLWNSLLGGYAMTSEERAQRRRVRRQRRRARGQRR